MGQEPKHLGAGTARGGVLAEGEHKLAFQNRQDLDGQGKAEWTPQLEQSVKAWVNVPHTGHSSEAVTDPHLEN